MLSNHNNMSENRKNKMLNKNKNFQFVDVPTYQMYCLENNV